ncbi:DNA repair protein RecN [Haloplasma contractile]|uniref:DNA repair protein RecN n=1 Tax=Haloplasma contractile SSD-17B TaxID=1033810 RepID=U2EGM6_9MOLU|nr:DNA repair protein RecN [Haloplasma contractile]ERJ13771.1 DNA repair protein RecN [Haloplasma contractile SSD-17B]
MLAQLKIKNFAIIDDIAIEFKNGMTTLTGETGSGKSIIIDAIHLLIGERASTDMVRHDKDKAIIEGLFFVANSVIFDTLKEIGIDGDDETLIIKREIAKNGRNICRINGTLVTVAQLKQIGVNLVDIHVQHDTHRLIGTDNYLYILDQFKDTELNNLIVNYQNHLGEYRKLVKEYKTFIKENKKNNELLDLYQYQLTEFKNANLSLEEYEDLSNKRTIISNYDKLYENLTISSSHLKDHILEKFFEASQAMGKIASYEKKYEAFNTVLNDLYYQIEDVTNSIGNELQTLDYDPSELDFIESRLNEYSILKRKYKMEIEELVKYSDELEDRINSINNFDDQIESYKQNIKSKFKICFDEALKIRMKRQKIAKNLKEQVIEQLKDLNLVNATFNIEFNKLDDSVDELNNTLFTDQGFDLIDFHVSFNKGEPAKPLSKTASGGELSRFMLALKTIITKKQNLSTVIFDEIDTGVSGITASAIASKIGTISKDTQVLCITHLAQVAAESDHHYYISKIENNNRTTTNVRLLSQDERIHELAKMMSGSNLTESALQSAKHLITRR